MIKQILTFFSSQKENLINKFFYILIAISFGLGILTYLIITKESYLNTPDPSLVIKIVLADLVALLILSIFLGRKLISHWYKSGFDKQTKLYKQISLMCALVSFVPTVIVSVFSTYFFNFGIQSWFDQRINNVLNQSLYVAESYIAENSLIMKETATSISADLSDSYYQLVQNPELFEKFVNAQAEVRSLNEVIVFQRTNKNIVAQSALSFSLAFTDVPDYLLDKADDGEIVELTNNKNKIQYLIKLPDYDDAYLIIGRFIDQNIINYIDKTHGALNSYYELKNKSHILQLNFSIIFILVALLLLLTSFYVGLLFADKLVRPINRLVLATDMVKKGDLTVHVEGSANNNEIDVLINAFNMMIRRLDYQQKDLLVAQRALAWSEVARRVAHEIKNPLTAIFLSSERLSKKFTKEVSDQESFQKYINNIFRLSDNIKTILTEFVNFARLPDPVFEKFELIGFIKEVIESRQIICENIGYIFNSSIQTLLFNGDQNQINQVLVNLLKNSEESILENNKNIKEIRINLLQMEQLLILELIDSGAGFVVDSIEKATEAYFTTRSKGTGLGLAIVKKIIHDHAGKINLGNSSEGGAKITLSFDLEVLDKKRVMKDVK
jgi:two-component system nitrogen regulation sensor histidine kinase NtrY